MAAPAAIEASRIWRRLSMAALSLNGVLLILSLASRPECRAFCSRMLDAKGDRLCAAAQGRFVGDSCAERAARFRHEIGDRSRTVEAQHGAGQCGHPGLV